MTVTQSPPAPTQASDDGATTFTTVMVTGHRPQHLDPDENAWMQVTLAAVAGRLRTVHGMREGISGMALGADLAWAVAVLASGADLAAYIPFEEQPKPWTPLEQATWREVRARAAREVVVGGTAFDVRKLHARNDAMLADTRAANGLVVAVYKAGTGGGTASAVAKARRHDQPLLVLDPSARTVKRDGW